MFKGKPAIQTAPVFRSITIDHKVNRDELRRLSPVPEFDWQMHTKKKKYAPLQSIGLYDLPVTAMLAQQYVHMRKKKIVTLVLLPVGVLGQFRYRWLPAIIEREETDDICGALTIFGRHTDALKQFEKIVSYNPVDQPFTKWNIEQGFVL